MEIMRNVYNFTANFSNVFAQNFDSAHETRKYLVWGDYFLIFW
jgi:hypothetical protein